MIGRSAKCGLREEAMSGSRRVSAVRAKGGSRMQAGRFLMGVFIEERNEFNKKQRPGRSLLLRL